MSNFDETLHPRDAGKFAVKDGSAPEAKLTVTPASYAHLIKNDFEGWDADTDHDGMSYIYRTGFELDLRTGQLTGFTQHKSENTQTFDEYHGYVMKFRFSGPTAPEIQDAVVAESLEDLGSLVASHDEHWDGNNFVATSSGLADGAVERIEARLEADNTDDSEYLIGRLEKLSELIDQAEVPDGITVGYELGYEGRSYTDDRTGESVDVSFDDGDQAAIQEQLSVALNELQAAVEAYDAEADEEDEADEEEEALDYRIPADLINKVRSNPAIAADLTQPAHPHE